MTENVIPSFTSRALAGPIILIVEVNLCSTDTRSVTRLCVRSFVRDYFIKPYKLLRVLHAPRKIGSCLRWDVYLSVPIAREAKAVIMAIIEAKLVFDDRFTL